MIAYQRRVLSTAADVGSPGPVPADLYGLADESLADIEAAVGHDAAEQLGYLDTGFFPVQVPDPAAQVSQTQFRIATTQLGQFSALDTAATALGGETVIRWQTQTVLSADQPWLQVLYSEALLGDADMAAAFDAAQQVPLHPV